MIRVLSFGAGVQSTCIARMSLDGELPPLDAMIFADTGAELPGTIESARQIEAACHNRGVEFITVRNTRPRSTGNLYDDLMGRESNNRWSMPPLFIRDEQGDGFTRRQCTGDFKIDPIDKAQRVLAGIGRRRKFPNGPEIEVLIGISVDEKQRMKVSDKPWRVYSYPLINLGMHRDNCEGWLRRNGYSIPPKSACFFCPYQSRTRWRELRDQHPDQWAKAVALDESLRSGRMLIKGTAYLHSDRVRLTDVDLRTKGERMGVGDLFADECHGVCGV